MTKSLFKRRQRLIADGRCPRCGLPVAPWPLRRADVCHVSGAVTCPRQWADIHAAESRIKVNR